MGFGQMDAAKPPVQRGHLCFHPFCREMETTLTVRRLVTPNPPVSTSELIIQGVARPLLDHLYAQYLHRAGSSRRGLPSLHLTSQLPSESGLPQDCLVRELLPYCGRIHSQGSTEASQGRYRRTHR